jgi:hypothetical protein
MQLPNGLQAYIPSEKLGAYLLSETHAVGKAKATFFHALGFNESNIPLLEHQLLTLAHSAPVQYVVPSPHGIKYIIEGGARSPQWRFAAHPYGVDSRNRRNQPALCDRISRLSKLWVAEEKDMIRELDTVVLVHDLEAYGLTQGDVGAVVHCYKDGMTFEVEFVTGEGATLAVLTLSQHDIRLMRAREILHVRALAETKSAD